MGPLRLAVAVSLKAITWNGLTAYYDRAEQAIMRELVDHRDALVPFIHQLKATFDGTLMDGESTGTGHTTARFDERPATGPSDSPSTSAQEKLF